MAEIEADELVGGPAASGVQEDEQVEQTEAPPETPAEPEPEEVSVVIEGESPPPEEVEERAPEWVRDLRKRHAEATRRQRELEEELKRLREAPAQAETPVGPKPTLEGCEYDAERYERDLESWHERKRAADESKREQQKQAEAEQQQWQQKLAAYAEERTALKVPDYEVAENLVLGTLSPAQQTVIVNYFPSRATLVYAIGKNPSTASRLASISDPIEFALAVADLSRKVQVTSKRTPPPPESKVQSTGSVAPSDTTLEKLRAEAAKTGDYSKVAAYKRAHK